MFLPLITIGLKMAAQQYAMSVAASADQTNRIAPMYQQYAEAIDLIVGQFSFRGIAVIDLMIATLTLTVFGVVISVRLRQSADNRGPRRAIILAGLAMILAMYSLNIRWPGGQFLTPAKRAASSPYQPANQLGRSLEMAIPEVR